MQCDLVKGLPLDTYPQQKFGMGEVILSHQIKTDRLPLVLAGRTHDPNLKKFFGSGDLLQLVDFFAQSHYRDVVVAKLPSTVVWIPRQDIYGLLTQQAPLTWTLARMVAIERRAVSMVAGI
jgi:hypothetical protein